MDKCCTTGLGTPKVWCGLLLHFNACLSHQLEWTYFTQHDIQYASFIFYYMTKLLQTGKHYLISWKFWLKTHITMYFWKCLAIIYTLEMFSTKLFTNLMKYSLFETWNESIPLRMYVHAIMAACWQQTFLSLAFCVLCYQSLCRILHKFHWCHWLLHT